MRAAKLYFIGIILGFSVLIPSCVEEEPKIIPDVYVDFTIYLDLPQFVALSSLNNAVKVPNEGYDENGVIVYRYTLDEYMAFDATCPQHVTISTSIDLDDGGSAGSATCPYCQTKYLLTNFGYPEKGYPLKKYTVTLSGRNLRVTN